MDKMANSGRSVTHGDEMFSAEPDYIETLLASNRVRRQTMGCNFSSES